MTQANSDSGVYRTASYVAPPKTVWCFKEDPGKLAKVGFYILLGTSVVTFLIALGHLIGAPAYSTNVGFWARVIGFLTLSTLGAWHLGLEKRNIEERQSAWKVLNSSEFVEAVWQIVVFLAGILWVIGAICGLWAFFSWSLQGANLPLIIRLGVANAIVSGLCIFVYYNCKRAGNVS